MPGSGGEEIPAGEHSPGHQLDDRIHRADAHAARPAPPAEHQITHERNIVVPRDQFPAAHAMRSRLHHAAIAWQTMNTDIEKAANQQAEYERESFYQGITCR